MSEFKPIVIIPSYNTGQELLESTLRSTLLCGFPLLVVIDGSTDGSEATVRNLMRDFALLDCLVKPDNDGKGETVLQAARHARSKGYTHALVKDADGQHPPGQIMPMIEVARRHPEALIMGQPVFGKDAPRIRVAGRQLTTAWTNLETLWCGLGDTLFGMRVYPIVPLIKAFEQTSFARGFDFDPEIAVRMTWAGTRPVRVPVPVRYLQESEGGVSHFNYLRDNLKLIFLHFRLVPEFLLVRLIPFISHMRQWKKLSS